MSDQEPSTFTVVDRRAAAAPEESAVTLEAAAASDREDAALPEEDAGDTPDMDPAFFLSYAAVQMDTRALGEALLAIFDTHAWRGLGLLSDARVGQTQQDLPSAQLAIDCFRALLEKIGGGMEPEELREAQRRLNDLQMNYLSRLQSAAR